MSVKIDEFIRIIETIAPPELASDWDNTGMQLRCGNEINRLLIALDVTDAIIDEAIQESCDMILCHHPLMFQPVKSLSCDEPIAARMMRLISSGISVYAAHTSYDRAKGGINDLLAASLGLSRIETFLEDGETLMRVGELDPPCDAKLFLNNVKTALDTRCLKISRKFCDSIDKVAVVGGSGGDFAAAAVRAGAKALITGEAKHHQFIDAESQNLLLVEAGHYDTERCFVEGVFISLQSCLNEVQLDLGLLKAQCMNSPYDYV